MRTVIVVFLILAFGIVDADARRRKYRHRYPPVFIIERAMPPYGERMRERWRPSGFDDRRASKGQMGRSDAAVGEPRESKGLAPDGWQLQPADPNWHGRRYVSPGGDAWVAFYAAPADAAALSAHMKTIAFAEGEEVTYLRGERDWIVVSGFKGERIFYRKAALACGGTRWHQVALEYPREMARSMDRYVARVARAVDGLEQEGCETSVSAQPQQ
jgi:hypothetical protein